MQKGFDIEDGELTSEELSGKYKGGILGTKAKSFNKLTIDDQKEVLYAGISGKETKVSKDIKDSPAHIFVTQRVKVFLKDLKRIKKLNEWVNRACSFQIFLRLDLDEKSKYHNVLLKFHDEHMKGKSAPKRVVDSSPTVGVDFPNFDDSEKWARK